MLSLGWTFEEAYMSQATGFVQDVNGKLVGKLNRSLYSLKRSFTVMVFEIWSSH